MMRGRSNSTSSTTSSHGSNTSRNAHLPLSPNHEHDTRRRSRLKSLANSLTVVEAASKFKRRLRRGSDASSVGSSNSREADPPLDGDDPTQGSVPVLDEIALPLPPPLPHSNENESSIESQTHTTTPSQDERPDEQLNEQQHVPSAPEEMEDTGLMESFIEDEFDTTSSTAEQALGVKATEVSAIPGWLIVLLALAVIAGVLGSQGANDRVPMNITRQIATVPEALVKAIVEEEVRNAAKEHAESIVALEKKVDRVEELSFTLTKLLNADIQQNMDPRLHAIKPWLEQLKNDVVSLVEQVSKQEQVRTEEPATQHGIQEEKENDSTRLTVRELEEGVDRLESMLKEMETKLVSLTNEIGAAKERESLKQQENQPSATSSSETKCDKQVMKSYLQEAKHFLKSEIERLQADVVGRADFALESLGSSIETRHGLTSPSYTSPMSAKENPFWSLLDPVWEWFTQSGTYNPFWRLREISRPPEAAIQPDMAIGACWACVLPKCNLTVKLKQNVLVDAVSIDHVSKLIAINLNSAPKRFQVYGLRRLPESSADESGYEHLGSFLYDAENGTQVQTFDVTPTASFSMIKFQFETNHGNPDYTCIYRVRVHGTINRDD